MRKDFFNPGYSLLKKRITTEGRFPADLLDLLLGKSSKEPSRKCEFASLDLSRHEELCIPLQPVLRDREVRTASGSLQTTNKLRTLSGNCRGLRQRQTADKPSNRFAVLDLEKNGR